MSRIHALRLLVFAAQLTIVFWLVAQLSTILPVPRGAIYFAVAASVPFILFRAYRIVSTCVKMDGRADTTPTDRARAFDDVDRATLALAGAVLAFSIYQFNDRYQRTASQTKGEAPSIVLTLNEFTDRQTSDPHPGLNNLFREVIDAIEPLNGQGLAVTVGADQIPKDNFRSGPVRYFLDGETRSSGAASALYVRLIAEPSGQSVWEQEYPLPTNKDTTSLITTALRTSISSIFRTDVDKPANDTEIVASRNEQAHALYLRAAELYRQEKHFDRADNKKAIDLLEEATRLDPDFAVAWSRLANAYASASWFGYFQSNSDKMHSTLMRLCELLGAEHFITLRTRGIYLYQVEGQLLDARRLLLRAVNKLPNDATANAYLGFIERRIGNSEAAEERLKTTLQVDPTFFPAITIVPQIITARRDAESLRTFLVENTKPQMSEGGSFEVFLGEMYDKYSPDTGFFYKILRDNNQQNKLQGLLSSFLVLRDPGTSAQSLYEERETALRTELDDAVASNRLSDRYCAPLRRTLLARAIWERNYRTVSDSVETTNRFFDILEICAEAPSPTRKLREPTDKAIALAIAGDHAAAEAAMRELTLKADALEDRLEAGLIYVNLARLALLLNDADKLAILIRRSDEATREFSALAYVMKFPEFDPYRKESPFQEMIAEHTRDVAPMLKVVAELAEAQ